MGNAPGNARGRGGEAEREFGEQQRHGKCHRKQTAAKESCCDGRQGNLLIV